MGNKHTFIGDFSQNDKDILASKISPFGWTFWCYAQSGGGYHSYNENWTQQDARVYGSTIDDMLSNLMLRVLV